MRKKLDFVEYETSVATVIEVCKKKQLFLIEAKNLWCVQKKKKGEFKEKKKKGEFKGLNSPFFFLQEYSVG